MWTYESEKGAGSKEEEARVHQEKGRRGEDVVPPGGRLYHPTQIYMG